MKSILVVDDTAVFREPVAASLRLAGHQAFCAADGEEALQMAHALLPDLILLDISMPKMDGVAFLRLLRVDPLIGGTPVILLTAVSDPKQAQAAMSLGAKHCLLKSRFSLKDLLRLIAPLELQNSGESTARQSPAEQHKPVRSRPANYAGGIPESV